MEYKLETKRSKVYECREESPILRPQESAFSLSYMPTGACIYIGRTYLALVEYCSETVEELEWRQDMALDQYSSEYCCSRPPARAHWHLEEPLLQRYLTDASSAAVTAAEHGVHGRTGEGNALFEM